MSGSLLSHKAATDCFYIYCAHSGSWIYLLDVATYTHIPLAPRQLDSASISAHHIRRSRRRIFNFSLANWKSSNAHTHGLHVCPLDRKMGACCVQKGARNGDFDLTGLQT